MDEPLRMNNQPGANLGRTAVPFALEGWLPAMPDRQILIAGVNEDLAADRTNQFIEEIVAHDSHLRTNDPAESIILHKGSNPNSLPYEPDRFDLVICPFLSARTEIKRETLAEIGHVLRPDGHLLIIDNLVPGSRLRGKKARQLRTAGEYVNTWMRLRKTRHKRFLSQDAWFKLLADAQWNIQQLATHEMAQDFDAWADCCSPSPNNRLRLQAMLLQAPEKVFGFLTPLESGDRIAFRMTELFILATKTNIQ
jgi:SAM-dependent methyltransferase